MHICFLSCLNDFKAVNVDLQLLIMALLLELTEIPLVFSPEFASFDFMPIQAKLYEFL